MAGNTDFHEESVVPLAPIDRMLDLSDGIFAFSMTLLILGIHIPELPQSATQAELLRQVAAGWPEMAIYIISFSHIASYWLLHHGVFVGLQHTNRTLMQLNLLFLLSVTFLPYPTSLLGEYGRIAAVALVYGITLVINYALLSVIGWYAHFRPEFAGEGLHLPYKRLLLIRLALPLVLAAIGTILALFFTRLAFLFFFLVALTNVIPIHWIVRVKKAMQ